MLRSDRFKVEYVKVTKHEILDGGFEGPEEGEGYYDFKDEYFAEKFGDLSYVA